MTKPKTQHDYEHRHIVVNGKWYFWGTATGDVTDITDENEVLLMTVPKILTETEVRLALFAYYSGKIKAFMVDTE